MYSPSDVQVSAMALASAFSKACRKDFMTTRMAARSASWSSPFGAGAGCADRIGWIVPARTTPVVTRMNPTVRDRLRRRCSSLRMADSPAPTGMMRRSAAFSPERPRKSAGPRTDHLARLAAMESWVVASKARAQIVQHVAPLLPLCSSRYPFRFRDPLSFGLLIPGLDPCFDRGFREIGRIRGPGGEGNQCEVVNFIMINEIFVSTMILNNIIYKIYNLLELRILPVRRIDVLKLFYKFLYMAGELD